MGEPALTGLLHDRHELFHEHPGVPMVLPLAVFLLVGVLEPRPPGNIDPSPAWGLPYGAYPWVYTVKILATAAAMLYALPVYRTFRGSGFGWQTLLVGIAGGGVWIGLCRLHPTPQWLAEHGLRWLSQWGARSRYNPWQALAGLPLAAWAFLAIRLLGLVLIVPIIEEFFLRGFLMRLFVRPDWQAVPVGTINAAAAVAGTAYGVLAHPGELLAALVWFSLITVLMVRTRSLWACVTAHGATNLVLGLYVLRTGQWQWM